MQGALQFQGTGFVVLGQGLAVLLIGGCAQGWRARPSLAPRGSHEKIICFINSGWGPARPGDTLLPCHREHGTSNVLGLARWPMHGGASQTVLLALRCGREV